MAPAGPNLNYGTAVSVDDEPARRRVRVESEQGSRRRRVVVAAVGLALFLALAAFVAGHQDADRTLTDPVTLLAVDSAAPLLKQQKKNKKSKKKGGGSESNTTSHSSFSNSSVEGDGLIGNYSLAAHNTSAASGDDDGDQCHVFKRTFASSDASLDAEFAVENLGWSLQMSASYTSTEDTLCAKRELLTTLGSFAVHFFTSHVSSEGHIGVDDWVSFWRTQHGDGKFSDPAFAWDTWMHYSMTFWAPTLEPFLVRWRANGVAFLGRQYTHAGDGETIYSAFVFVPNSGVVLEIMTAHVPPAAADSFRSYEAASCPDANHVNTTATAMQAAWHAAGGHDSNFHGLPDMLLVKLTQPTAAARTDDMGNYLREFASSNITQSGPFYASYGDDADHRRGHAHDETRECQWSSAVLRKVADVGRTYAESDDWHIELRTVRNPLAAGGLHATPTTVGHGVPVDPVGTGNETNATAAADGAEPMAAASASAAAAAAARALSAASIHVDDAETNVSHHSFNFSVAAYEKYVDEMNLMLLGCNTGWSRYLDWHIGVQCKSPRQTLDRIGPKLCATGHGFHAHVSSPNKRVSATGSIWTGGVGGLGVEFHMDFDYSFFNKSQLSLLNYCSSSSGGTCTESSCDMTDSI